MEMIEPASIEDVDILTEIAKRSKAHWGYSEKDLLEWDGQLTITEQYLKKSNIYKLVKGNLIAGYYAFLYETEDVIRIDYFFVSPEFIGKGIGNKLLSNFIERVKAKTNVKAIILDADPNAQGL